MEKSVETYDALIIGSGFGGSMMAKKLCDAGWKVAMIERGKWVKREPSNWSPKGSIDLSEYYDKSNPYRVEKGGNRKQMGVYSCVGGPSVFYGGVSFRFREKDFEPPNEIIGNSGAEWPIKYQDLSPYYDQAESILNISGSDAGDLTAPERNVPYKQKPNSLSQVSGKLESAAKDLGLSPFRLPLAMNYTDNSRNLCESCTTCDTFACAIEAKNDLATVILKELVGKGLDLYASSLAFGVEVDGNLITEVKCINQETGKVFSLKARQVVLSAGALASPQFILSNGLEQFSQASDLVGRYLMRHVNSIVFGIFSSPPDKEKRFHKELGILDFYFGHKDISYPTSKIGSLQQVPTPPVGLVEHEAPWPLGKLAAVAVPLLTGLLSIAEDQPQYKNRIFIKNSSEGLGKLSEAYIWHEYSERDLKAIKVLNKEAKKIMKKMGAMFTYTHPIRTFSHAVGTMRMGSDPKTSVLDANCNFRGLDNLFVVDASFMPSSGALNPSLTISANALRVGDFLIENF